MKELIREDFIMPFGKYKGKDLLEISEINPSYILWLNTLDKYQVSNSLLDYCQRQLIQPDLHDDWGMRDSE